jgi:hypothetical protein
MKCNFKQFTLFVGRFMGHRDQPPEFQFPFSRAIGVASFVCFVSLILVYWIARPAVRLIEVRWVGWLAYALLPVTVTFITLYRSSWHPEMRGAARTGSVLLVSCVILGCILLIAGTLVSIGWFYLSGISPRSGGR